MKKYKIIFADLDGTLIDTISGSTFPKGIWDMKLRFDVLNRIKEIGPLALLIVSDQGGIVNGRVHRKFFELKMEYICRSIREYAMIFTEYIYCTSNDENDYYRKPNCGMLKSMYNKVQISWFRGENIQKSDCIMIGDASGKEGQFSDSDKKTAENFGIDYLDVKDFLKVEFE